MVLYPLAIAIEYGNNLLPSVTDHVSLISTTLQHTDFRHNKIGSGNNNDPCQHSREL